MILRPTRRRRKHGQPEHGDWRLPLDRPAESEHLPTLPVSLWKRVQLQAATWQEAECDVPITLISGWSRALRIAIGALLLLPLCSILIFALGLQLYRAADTVKDLGFWLSDPVWFTLVGLSFYIALFIVKLAEPLLVYIYVLGHESTHALAALLSFGKVNAFHFDMEGGYVETDTDNLFVALSPYFVPLWMLLWMLLLWAGNALCPFAAYEAWFYGGMGFWWAFHLYWTCWVIHREQPDMLENGVFFSLLVVLLTNIGVLLGILCCFGVITPAGYAHEVAQLSQQLWHELLGLGQWLVGFVG